MATIKLKNGSGAPLASDLVQGEPALDLTNKRLYTEDTSGAVIEVGVNPTELNVTGDITVGGTVDGRDVATDGTKLDGIEAGADVTDTANVTAAGAVMDSELTNETAVKALNQGVATTDSPTFAGLTTTADVSFGDNDKAIFGAGSDLQIYHDGTHSVIDDTGTGNLILQSNGAQVSLQSTTEYYLTAANNGAVTAYYDGSAKLATTSTGIDVTGNTESDTVTIGIGSVAGSEKLRVNGTVLTLGGSVSAPAIGIGDTNTGVYAPTAGQLGWTVNGTQRLFLDSTGIDVTGTVTADGLTVQTLQGDITIPNSTSSLNFSRAGFNYIRATDTSGSLSFIAGANDFSTQRLNISNNGDISFYNSAGTSQDLFWDASTSRLGLGTTSPSVPLDVRGSVKFGDTATGISFEIESTDEYRINGFDVDGNAFNSLHFRADGTDGLFVQKDTNNVGIGTTAPSTTLELVSNGAFASSNGNTNFTGVGLHISPSGTTSTSGLQYGAITWGEPNPSFGGYQHAAIAPVQTTTDSNQVGLSFLVHSSATRSADLDEAVRIDSSGNLLVGKTAPDNTTQGITIYGSTAPGAASFVRDSGNTLVLNRLTTDGEILALRKDGTTVGSIGSIASDLYIAEGNSGLRFDGENNQILPSSTTASTDGTCNLGASSARFQDLYATNGTIQTSDRNEKQDIEEPSKAEQRVAVAAKGLLRKFRWKSAVEEKGDDARIHFGIIAQDLQDAFTAEGLDAGRYGMFINTTWTDEETGEERSRMGVRYSELLAFIISAI